MHRWLCRTFLAVILSQLCACSAYKSELRTAAIRRGTTQTNSLRVMTFNVRSCSEGIDRVAEAIQEASPDVVALQEVDNGTRRAGGLDQARELGRRLGLPYAVHIPATQMHGGDYGMALLSRVPVVSLDQRPLPVDRGMEPRVVARAVLLVDGVEVSLYKAHLSPMPQRSELRREQAAFVARLMAADERPKILVGDLNDVATSPAVRLLTSRLQDAWAKAGTGDAGTYPLPLLGTFRYDYVLASTEFEVQRSFVLQGDASDHYPVIADLALPVEWLATSD
ncbi:endonuclease/exonuclease/phosphatase family protein [Vulgatibacter sp.]|uniref:endonuclease/exonuclease/phosphatase family protein n=1 Tax=Vulgatibacter sp. TaxID=1971226 RepID=UPI003563B28C